MKTILITGVAGFIGSNLAKELVKKYKVVGIDNFNNYYNPQAKKHNIQPLLKNKYFKFYREDILNKKNIKDIFKDEKPEIVIHLAAKCGVRNSVDQKKEYFKINVDGTKSILDSSHDSSVKQFILASSSSVYGELNKYPFKENEKNLKQTNPYGKSKYNAEILCNNYSKKYNLSILIFRFFTVYGPHGRPDMAPYIFTDSILKDKKINIYGKLENERDFTYISDIVDAIKIAIEKNISGEIINLGGGNPISLNKFIKIIEKHTSKKAVLNYLPSNKFEMKKTYADINKANKILNWKPKVNIERGLKNYINFLKSSESKLH